MEKAGIILNFKEKKITVYGKVFPMLQTSSGHPVLKVQTSVTESLEEVLLVTNFESGTRTEQKKGMVR